MYLKKKIIKLLSASLLISALFATTCHAEEAEDVGFRSLNLNNMEIKSEESEPLADTSSNMEAASILRRMRFWLMWELLPGAILPVFM